MIRKSKTINQVLVVVGPTATNKTLVAINLAKEFDGEIINADAFQVYKELNVGVNKPSTKELASAKFHLIGTISINQKWDIKHFQDEANSIIQDIYTRGKLPIIVGGSHLYVDALINNYDLSNISERDSKYADLSNQDLFNKLSKLDKSLADKIGESNHNRLVRALQITESGKTLNKTNTSLYEPLYVLCTKPRDLLYDDINKRVDSMIRHG
jgi:tRNA dimethylallyltransferase